MTKNISICALLCAITAVVIIAACAPQWLSDRNGFLKHFVNHELLALLGIIMTITLASAANLHLVFNGIEERFKKPGGLTKTRQGVTQGAYCLIGLFVLSVFTVLAKPAVVGNQVLEAAFNGAAMIFLLWNVLILVEITQLAFAIEPNVAD